MVLKCHKYVCVGHVTYTYVINHYFIDIFQDIGSKFCIHTLSPWQFEIYKFFNFIFGEFFKTS